MTHLENNFQGEFLFKNMSFACCSELSDICAACHIVPMFFREGR